MRCSATSASPPAAAVATAALLALREKLHGWVTALTWPELRSGLVLLAMTFIALPLVPDDPVGPFGGVNPREIWLIAIVLAGVSFLGYAAVKYFGARHGVLLAAAAGGLVSSTAVTRRPMRAARRPARARRACSRPAYRWRRRFRSLRVLAIVAVLKPSLLVAARAAACSPRRSRPSACAVVCGLLARECDGDSTAGEAPQSLRLLVGDRLRGAAGRDHPASAACSATPSGAAGAIIGAAVARARSTSTP